MSHHELPAIFEQAARNLETLELLVREAGQHELDVAALRERLRALHTDYVRETDALTQHVLMQAVERRTMTDRRSSDRRESRHHAPRPTPARGPAAAPGST